MASPQKGNKKHFSRFSRAPRICPRYKTYTHDTLLEAMAYVKDNKASVKEVSRMFGVPSSTLTDKIKKYEETPPKPPPLKKFGRTPAENARNNQTSVHANAPHSSRSPKQPVTNTHSNRLPKQPVPNTPVQLFANKFNAQDQSTSDDVQGSKRKLMAALAYAKDSNVSVAFVARKFGIPVTTLHSRLNAMRRARPATKIQPKPSGKDNLSKTTSPSSNNGIVSSFENNSEIQTNNPIKRKVKVTRSESRVVVDLSEGDTYNSWDESMQTASPDSSIVANSVNNIDARSLHKNSGSQSDLKMSAAKKRRIDEILHNNSQRDSKSPNLPSLKDLQKDSQLITDNRTCASDQSNITKNSNLIHGTGGKQGVAQQSDQKTVFKFFSKESLEKALNFVKQNMGSIAQASQKFGVPHIVIQNKLREQHYRPIAPHIKSQVDKAACSVQDTNSSESLATAPQSNTQQSQNKQPPQTGRKQKTPSRFQVKLPFKKSANNSTANSESSDCQSEDSGNNDSKNSFQLKFFLNPPAGKQNESRKNLRHMAYKQYTQEMLKEAVEYVLEHDVSVAVASNMFRVPQTTIGDRLRQVGYRSQRQRNTQKSPSDNSPVIGMKRTLCKNSVDEPPIIEVINDEEDLDAIYVSKLLAGETEDVPYSSKNPVTSGSPLTRNRSDSSNDQTNSDTNPSNIHPEFEIANQKTSSDTILTNSVESYDDCQITEVIRIMKNEDGDNSSSEQEIITITQNEDDDDSTELLESTDYADVLQKTCVENENMPDDVLLMRSSNGQNGRMSQTALTSRQSPSLASDIQMCQEQSPKKDHFNSKTKVQCSDKMEIEIHTDYENGHENINIKLPVTINSNDKHEDSNQKMEKNSNANTFKAINNEITENISRDKETQYFINKCTNESQSQSNMPTQSKIQRTVQSFSDLNIDFSENPELLYIVEKICVCMGTVPTLVDKESQQEILSTKKGTFLTMIACCNGVGTVLPPYFVLPDSINTSKINTLLEHTSPGAQVNISGCGLCTVDVLNSYIVDHFCRFAQVGCNYDSDRKKAVIMYDDSCYSAPNNVHLATSVKNIQLCSIASSQNGGAGSNEECKKSEILFIQKVRRNIADAIHQRSWHSDSLNLHNCLQIIQLLPYYSVLSRSNIMHIFKRLGLFLSNKYCELLLQLGPSVTNTDLVVDSPQDITKDGSSIHECYSHLINKKTDRHASTNIKASNPTSESSCKQNKDCMTLVNENTTADKLDIISQGMDIIPGQSAEECEENKIDKKYIETCSEEETCHEGNDDVEMDTNFGEDLGQESKPEVCEESETEKKHIEAFSIEENCHENEEDVKFDTNLGADFIQRNGTDKDQTETADSEAIDNYVNSPENVQMETESKAAVQIGREIKIEIEDEPMESSTLADSAERTRSEQLQMEVKSKETTVNVTSIKILENVRNAIKTEASMQIEVPATDSMMDCNINVGQSQKASDKSPRDSIGSDESFELDNDDVRNCLQNSNQVQKAVCLQNSNQVQKAVCLQNSNQVQKPEIVLAMSPLLASKKDDRCLSDGLASNGECDDLSQEKMPIPESHSLTEVEKISNFITLSGATVYRRGDNSTTRIDLTKLMARDTGREKALNVENFVSLESQDDKPTTAVSGRIGEKTEQVGIRNEEESECAQTLSTLTNDGESLNKKCAKDLWINSTDPVSDPTTCSTGPDSTESQKLDVSKMNNEAQVHNVINESVSDRNMTKECDEVEINQNKVNERSTEKQQRPKIFTNVQLVTLTGATCTLSDNTKDNVTNSGNDLSECGSLEDEQKYCKTRTECEPSSPGSSDMNTLAVKDMETLQVNQEGDSSHSVVVDQDMKNQVKEHNLTQFVTLTGAKCSVKETESEKTVTNDSVSTCIDRINEPCVDQQDLSQCGDHINVELSETVSGTNLAKTTQVKLENETL